MGGLGSPCSRTSDPRLGALCAVIAAHGFVIAALTSAMTFHGSAAELHSLPAILVLTNNFARVTTERVPPTRDVVVLQDPEEHAISLPAVPVVRYDEPNAQAVSVAPQLLDVESPDMAPFAQQAGLRPGESAVVVLRVEVLSDGHVGQVQVDVSSGSLQVDKAAAAYARQIAWVPGRLHGIDESTWVRYGVRLVA